MPTKIKKQRTQTLTEIRQDLARANLEYDLHEARYASSLLKNLQENSDFGSNVVVDDERGFQMISSGTQLITGKEYNGPGISRTNLLALRRASYRLWRLNPHARGVLRAYCKYIIGREFKLDFADTAIGHWDDPIKRDRLTKTAEDMPARDGAPAVEDSLLARLVWDDFVEHNAFTQRAKELVLRTLRDGEMFLRRFVRKGRVLLRFIEPEAVANEPSKDHGEVEPGDVEDDSIFAAGDKTTIKEGIEYLENDVETVVAYWVRVSSSKYERVPAKDVRHVKCLSDSNDLRGIPLLECVMKKLTNYEQWEEYRIILNKVRTAVALVRKIDSGTAGQAASLIAGRQPVRAAPNDRQPATTSGRREAMFRAGTVLTPGPGVSYDFVSPNLQARDAAEDGRRILLTVAAGVGLPEMLVTSDYSNSAFASTESAMRAVQREWEDWQDFFQPTFEQIYRWVLEAAVERGLPTETNRAVEVQWPTIIKADAEKETKRRSVLHSSGVLSSRTWAAQEGLVFDDERENRRQDDESETFDTELQQQLADALAGDDNPDAPPDDDSISETKPPRRRIVLDKRRGIEESVRTAHDTLGVVSDLEEMADKSKHMSAGEKVALKNYVGAVRKLVLSHAPITILEAREAPKRTKRRRA